MGYNDDYEYDDEEYYEDDEEYVDYDEDGEDSSSSKSSFRSPFSSGGSSSRFGGGASSSGGLPGSSSSGSRFGGGSSRFGASSSSDDDEESSSGSGSRFGGGASSGTSRFGGGGSSTPSRFGGSGGDDKKDDSSSGSRFGGGASSGTSRFGGGASNDKKDDSSSGNRFGGTSRFGGSGGDDKKDDSSSGSRFGGASSSGGGTSRFGGGASNDKKDDSSSSSNRFGGGGSSSRFGGSGGDDKKDDSSSTSRFGGGSSSSGGGTSRFGGGASNDKKDDSSSSGNRFGGGTSRFGGSGGDDKKDDSSSSGNRFGGGSSSSGGTSRFGGGASNDKKDDSSSSGNRFGGGSSSSGGGGTSRFGGGASNDKKDDSSSSGNRFGGGGTSSRFGGGADSNPKTSTSTGTVKAVDDKSSGSSGGRFSFGGGNKPEDKKDDKPASGGFANRFGGGNKPEDKKDDKASSGGGFGSRFGAGNKPEEKKDDKPAGGGFANRFGGGNKPEDKKDDKPTGGGFGLGGITSRFGAGNKQDDKKDDKPAGGGINRFGAGNKQDDKKDDKSSSGGGFGNRFGSNKPDDKKDDKPASGGFSNRFGSNKPDDKKDDTSSSSGSRFGSFGSQSAGKGDSPATSKGATGGAKAVGDGGTKSPFAKAREEGKDDKKSSKTAAAAVTSDSGGIFGRVTGAFGGIFGGAKDDEAASSKASSPKAAASSSKKSASKVPVAKSEEGLTLDNWLDIIGVGLVFGSLILFFSAISQEQAAIAGIHNLLGEIFGWGALSVPITMLLIGGWLIVRHFGEDAPTVDPIRVAGVVIIFVSALVLFQWIDSFNYEIPAGIDNQELLNQFLALRVNQSWDVFQSGGGWIGAQIYLFLVNSITEIGMFLVIIFTTLIGLMLITRMSAAQMVRASGSLVMNLREGMKQRAVQRRAERELAEQRAREEQARIAASLMASQEVAYASVPAASTSTQQAAAIPADAGREIRMNLGGQAQTIPMQQGQVAQNVAPTAYQQYPQYQQPAPQAAPQANNSSGGLFGRFLRQDNSPAPTNGGNFPLFGLGSSGGNTQAPPPPILPDTPLPMDDGYSHFDTGPMKPAASSAPQPQRLGDMLRNQPAAANPQPAAQAPVNNFTPQPQAEAETVQQPAASAVSSEQQEVNDFLKQRQERLNALREGQTGPLSQSALARARQEDVQSAVVPSSESDRESSFGTFQRGIGEAVRAERAEASNSGDNNFSRPSQLPSVQAAGDTGPKQQMLEVGVDKPLSSQVTNVTRAQRPNWKLPDYSTLLSSGSEQEFDRERLLKQAKTIEETLESFGAPGRVVEVNTGPVITQFGVEPDYLQGRTGKKQRVKVSAIAALDKDLQLALGARSIRVEAPVPGKGYVGVEVPNAETTVVSLRDVMDAPSFSKHNSPLTIALGQSVSGAPISADLASMPHLLIAGTTGSGKSVCVNSIIASILSRNTPEQVKFIMVDPKRVELTGYNGIPHLVAPVVVELERIVGVLKWVTREMDARYKRFSEAGARNIEDYNKHRDPNTTDPMPYMVVIIDELADLMMLAPEETERTITRIAALARATGIHLVIATQRPSVDVVTGLIKANFPARIAFAVAGSVDSRVILDQPGAERLLGKGDMLWMSGDSPAPLRLQGVFVSDMEINNIVRYWKMQSLQMPDSRELTLAPKFGDEEDKARSGGDGKRAFWDNSSKETLTEDLPLFAAARRASTPTPAYADDEDDDEDIDFDIEDDLSGDVPDGEEDDMYDRAVEMVRRLDKASVSLLQRRLRIGYTRAARLIDVMEARGVVGPAKDGSSKPRDVLQ